MSFASLHTHSQYSILDASIAVDVLPKIASQRGIQAVALTDHGNLFGVVDFYKACLKAKIKPLVGCELYIAPSSRLEKRKSSGERVAYSVVLIAKNIQGYKNLCKLSSSGYLEGFYYYPRIDKELLAQHSEGLICLSSSLSGSIPQLILKNDVEALRKEIQWYYDVFGSDFYFEIQRHEMSRQEQIDDEMDLETWVISSYKEYVQQQKQVNEALCVLSDQWKIPLVAAQDAHYLNREDWKAHEVLLNVQSGEPRELIEKDALGRTIRRMLNPKRQIYPTHNLYLKSADEMAALFHDIPEAIENTIKIANQCSLELDFYTKHYPVYYPPHVDSKNCSHEEQKQEAELFLKKLCAEGLKNLYNEEALAHVARVYPGKDPKKVVEDRLAYELDIIISKELGDYLLIVYDFIHWAKTKGIPVGPGRGSGAGSIVLFLLGITSIEPLRFHLFFERFINPERLSYPDIDVDICMDSRDRVIDYTVGKYGKDNVAQIITFGTMKAKMAVKDVGRVLSVPLTKVNHIAKLIPEDPNMTLEKALSIDPELFKLYQEDDETKSIIDFAKKLEGSIRNTGIHAAGVIISGQPLVEHIPVCASKDAQMAVSQYSMKPVESVGMLKVDFLGLKTLTSIKKCVDFVKENYGRTIDWVALPLDDVLTFELLNQGKTLGVFQLESPGMQDLARQLHLDRFEEIIAVVSLYRPGPMDMIPSYIQRKHGREPIEYEHPWLKDILEETYGIMVYQEQVMQIAQKLASYSLGEGDVLRRAMGKKIMEEMAQQREAFRIGAVKNNIEDAVAMSIFDKMEKFAAYGFNKSHAAAYAYLSYVTAYFKANYPKEWMAALMTCDSDDITKVAKFITECQSMKIDILPPDINEAQHYFKATSEGIRFAMSGIKGVGHGVVEAIVEERSKKGAFRSLFDFIQRIDTKRVGKKAIELLILAGAFDFTSWPRDALIQSVEGMYEAANKQQKEAASGFLSLFSLMGDEEQTPYEAPPKEILHPLSKKQLLSKEKELLGFYLTGHPLEEFRVWFPRLSCVELSKMLAMRETKIFRTVFVIEVVKTRISAKSQKKFAIITASDGHDKFEIAAWPEVYETISHLLEDNKLVYAIVHQEVVESEVKWSCKWMEDLSVVNESIIEECDKAYDRAKASLERFQIPMKKNKKTQEDTPPSSPSSSQQVTFKMIDLYLDLSQVRFSDIVFIKQLALEFAGSVPYSLCFLKDDAVVGKVEVGAHSGLSWTPDLEKKLKEITALKKIISK